MTTCLVEQHTTATATDDDRHLTARGGTGCQLCDCAIGCVPCQLIDVVHVKQFETDCVPNALTTRLHAGIASGNTAHGKERAHRIVFDKHSIGVGNEDSTAVVAVTHRPLRDRVAN